ncbi:proprotein convertase P-domain-containing protein [Actinokineospora sp. HUAS TT18]|uniref:proprotein convertase P-domain-containing protein n=1 Tax=Actinokineospora sp. HUAS TT18 TaxID=3447451 RepID=UPI003F51CFA8
MWRRIAVVMALVATLLPGVGPANAVKGGEHTTHAESPHNQSGGSADNIDRSYSVNLSGESANGTWKPRVRDVYQADVGTIDTWSLNLTP